jgi:hypothetical protein
MAQPSQHIEDLQTSRYMDAQQVNREQAMRQALSVLDPHNDDQQQAYPEILRRLYEAIGRELARNIAPGA